MFWVASLWVILVCEQELLVKSKRSSRAGITLVSGINKTAAALNMHMTPGGDAPALVDPFLKNMTVSDFMAGVLGSMETQENVKAWFNNKLYTSLPIFTSFLSNALLRVESKDTDPSKIGIIAINHPMNQTVRTSFDAQASSKLIVFRIVLILLVLCLIPAGFTVFLVEGRIYFSKLYH
ncbi:hypothetical protein COOONC_19442 [Cooperia oncophora]